MGQKNNSISLGAELRSRFKEISGALSILLNYIVTDIDKRPRIFKIGVFSVFLVVTFLVVLQSALHMTPIVFLRLAENQSGQYDLTLAPVAAANDTRLDSSNDDQGQAFYRGLNFTLLQQQLKDVQEISGMAPRWILPVSVSNPDTPNDLFHVVALVLDSKLERESGFGSNIELKDLSLEECWITDSIAMLTQLKGQNKIHIYADILKTLTDMQALASTGGGSSSDSLPRAIATELVDQQFTANGGRKIDNERYAFGNGPYTVTVGRLLKGFGRTLQQAIPDDFLDSFNWVITAPDGSQITIPVDASGLPSGTTSDQVTLIINSTPFINAMIPAIQEGLTIDQDFTVVETVESPNGKWPSTLGNIIVLDSKYIVGIFAENMATAVENTKFETGNPTQDDLVERYFNKTEVQENIRAQSKNITLNDYALTVNILLTDRVDIYHSQNSIRPGLITASNAIYSILGRNHPSSISSLLMTALDNFFLFKNFLDNIFNSTVFILILLSALLIYSLMNSNVEEKTYEFGMLRALGMKQVNLTTLLVIQSMFFAIPGLALGYILSFALNFLVSYYISNLATVRNDIIPSTASLILGACMAIFVPLGSNYFPIKKAMAKTLRDSLNLYGRTVSDVTVRIIKLAQLGISPAQTIGALTLVVMGFLTYYLAPYSFIFQNIPLFFIILNIVMMMMVIGCTLVMNLVQPISERIMLKLLMLPMPKEKVLAPVINKNFDAHRKRNNKTSLMYSIALAFLIFSGTGFKLNSEVIAKTLMALSGSDLLLMTTSSSIFLDEPDLRTTLDNFGQKYPGILKDYSFVSHPFRDMPYLNEIRISSLTSDPYRNTEIYSVDKSYMNSIYEELFVDEGLDPSFDFPKIRNSDKPDISAALYSTDGITTNINFDAYKVTANAIPYNLNLNSYIGTKEIRFLISKGLAGDVSLATDVPALISSQPVSFQARVRAIASKLPGFVFSGYRTNGDYVVVTSHEDFAYMRSVIWGKTATADQRSAYLNNIPTGSSYNVAKKTLLIRYQGDIDKEMRKQLVNTIETRINGDEVLVVNVYNTVESLKSTLVFIDIFFILVAVIAISLSFFFTIISFTSNITENGWEFGVLRAIGLSKKQMTKVYVLEALSLILAATVLGTAVGISVACVSSSLFFLFTELPFTLEFPTSVFLVAIGTSILTAFFASKIAVDDIKNKQIASIIKSLD